MVKPRQIRVRLTLGAKTGAPATRKTTACIFSEPTWNPPIRHKGAVLMRPVNAEKRALGKGGGGSHLHRGRRREGRFTAKRQGRSKEAVAVLRVLV